MFTASHTSVIFRPYSDNGDSSLVGYRKQSELNSQEISLDEFYDNEETDTSDSHHRMLSPGLRELSSGYENEESRRSAISLRRGNNMERNREIFTSSNIRSLGNCRTENGKSRSVERESKQAQFVDSNMYIDKSISKNSTWNKLNVALCIGIGLLSAAISVPVTLIPTIARSLVGTLDDEWTYYSFDNTVTALEVYDQSGTRKRWMPFRIRTKRSSNFNQNISVASSFASRLAATATLATAFGKFVNGPLVDIAGARRLLLVYGLLISVALVALKYSYTSNAVIGCCAAIEFFGSVLWPSVIVILGAHYKVSDASSGNGQLYSDRNFNRGIHLTSIASRCGSFLAIPLSSLVLKWTTLHWRELAGFAAATAFVGVVVFFFCLTDSPSKLHDPQNPVRLISKKNKSHESLTSSKPWDLFKGFLLDTFVLCSSAFYTVLPSLRIVLTSRVFWVVAAAHAGATMVKTSERILGTYYRDTSYGMVTEEKAGAMTVFLSLGMLGGLIFGGVAFAQARSKDLGIPTTDDEISKYNKVHTAEVVLAEALSTIDVTHLRPKNMIAFFYCLAICMSYILSILAIPFIRTTLHVPAVVLILQAIATLLIGAGVAVQYYHIPAIVGATYGSNRGLYASYTDGVASLVSSIVWHIVGCAVEEGDPQGLGWVYGWAAVALLLIFSGTLMVGIMEVYFVNGGWRHQIEQDNHIKESDFKEVPSEMNGSWMEDEIRMTRFSQENSSLSRWRGMHMLSSSAYEFLSPGRPQCKREFFLRKVHSLVEEEVIHEGELDLLGIDDDGSLLHPSGSLIEYQSSKQKTPQNCLEKISQHDHVPYQLSKQLKRRRQEMSTQFETKSDTDFSADYISFSGGYSSEKCQVTFTTSEDGGSSIRETSIFDKPHSVVENIQINSGNSQQFYSFREGEIPSPIDSFSL